MTQWCCGLANDFLGVEGAYPASDINDVPDDEGGLNEVLDRTGRVSLGGGDTVSAGDGRKLPDKYYRPPQMRK